MRTGAQSPRRRAGVFDELALRIRQMIRDEHENTASGHERFTVTGTGPLVLEQLHGDLVLEDGDPDFSIGKAVLAAAPAVGDIVWVARSSGDLPEFHAFDVVS